MNARYYDPVVGRFAAMDPVGPLDGGIQHINRYSYVYNNPFRYTDPSGMYGLAGNRGNAPEGFDPEHDAIAKGSIKELKDAKGNRIPGDEYRRHLQWNNLAIKKDPFLIAAALLPGLRLLAIEETVVVTNAARAGTNSVPGYGANSAVNAVNLEKQLASKEQLGQLANGGGTVISQPAKQAVRIASQNGLNPSNIQKVSSDVRVSRDGQHIETHAFRDAITNQVIEPKTIIGK